MSDSTEYPVFAHLWAAGWILVPAGLTTLGWWAVHRFGTDPVAPLRALWRSVEIFLYAGTAAILAQLVVPALAAVPVLRRTHSAALGLAAGALAGALVVGFGR